MLHYRCSIFYFWIFKLFLSKKIVNIGENAIKVGKINPIELSILTGFQQKLMG